ncbi:TPA: hypothetical protein DDW35_11935 [Candidatus Sumerlaeota bacterium]|nr:hypothetical protein [Candidatus Sumerlaeota bacterium]
MKNRAYFQHPRRGTAILVAVMLLGMVLLLLTSALIGMSSYQTRDRTRYELYKDEFCAEEEAINRVYGHMQFRVKNSGTLFTKITSVLTSTECAPASTITLYNPVTALTSTFNISDFTLTKLTETTSAITYSIKVRAKKQQTNGLAVTPGVVLTEKVVFTRTSLCNFAIFYDNDMEIAPGANMTVAGKVHSNGNMYLGGGGANLDITGKTTAVGKIYGGRYSESGQGTSGTGSAVSIANASGNLTSMYRNDTTSAGWIDSLDSDWYSKAISTWGGQVQDAAFSVTSQDIEGLSDSDTSDNTNANHTIIDSSSSSSSAFVKQAGLIISSSVTSVNGTTASGTVSAVDATGKTVYLNYYTLNGVTYATNRATGSTVSTTVNGKTVSATVNSVVSTSAFYNAREGKTVASVNVDVGKIATAAAATQTDTYSSGSSTYGTVTGQYSVLPSNGIIYINNSTTVSSAEVGVRLTDAATLPVPTTVTGLSFVSDDPMYVQGDYNTTNATLSMVAGDAVTLLSNNWSDQSSSGYSKGTSSSTAYNAVFINGIVASANSKYSGGVENYFRLLENWDSKTLTFKGSILELFKSTTATSPWTANSGYYNAPKRSWTWDSALATDGPPGMPNVVSISRASWAVSN